MVMYVLPKPTAGELECAPVEVGIELVGDVDALRRRGGGGVVLEVDLVGERCWCRRRSCSWPVAGGAIHGVGVLGHVGHGRPRPRGRKRVGWRVFVRAVAGAALLADRRPPPTRLLQEMVQSTVPPISLAPRHSRTPTAVPVELRSRPLTNNCASPTN